MKILLPPCKRWWRDDPKRVRRSAATWLGARSETMSSGRRCARTAERRDKVGDLRRDGLSRERRPSPRTRILRRAARWTRAGRKPREGLVREAHGSCATSTVASGALVRSLERRKPRRASAPARSKPLRDGTEPPGGAERPEGGRRRPPSFPAATVRVGPAARRVPRRGVAAVGRVSVANVRRASGAERRHGSSGSQAL